MTKQYVIRSMTTTDYDGRNPVRPYHVYLKPERERFGAWWAGRFDAERFDTIEEAKAARERAGNSALGAQIAATDAEARGLPNYWDENSPDVVD
jgi:hypothetical protein